METAMRLVTNSEFSRIIY